MAPDLTPEQREIFANALYSGRKIDAIKELRESSGLGLKESKEIIDRLEDDLREAHPERFTRRASKGFGCVILVILLIVGGAILWALMIALN
jgi:hypothetical protein